MITGDLDEDERTRWSFMQPSATLHLSAWREPSTLASSLLQADPMRVETDASITRAATRREAARQETSRRDAVESSGRASRTPQHPLPSSRIDEVPPQLRAILGLMEQEDAPETETETETETEPRNRGQLPGAVLPPPTVAPRPATMRPPARRGNTLQPSGGALQAGASMSRVVIIAMVALYVLAAILSR